MSTIHILAAIFMTFQVYRLANVKKHAVAVAYIHASEDSTEEIAAEVAQAGLAPALTFMTFAEMVKTLFLMALLFTAYWPVALFLLAYRAAIHRFLNIGVLPLYLFDITVSLVVLGIIAVSPIF